MLTLLTYGDINGVGPGTWNEWKDALLWELYTKARQVFSPDSSEEKSVEPLRQRIALMLASEVAEDEVREHFDQLPEDYGRSTPSQVIIEHIRLAHTLNSRPVRLSWRVNAQARCTDLHFCARNDAVSLRVAERSLRKGSAFWCSPTRGPMARSIHSRCVMPPASRSPTQAGGNRSRPR